MVPDFYSKTHAKWILSGEHAVLRGYPALVFPLPGKYIEWYYWQTEHALEVDFNLVHEEGLLVLFWNVFEHALQLLDKKQHEVRGKFSFHPTIPMGAGMGFSAAFCVGLTRWFIWKQWLPATAEFEFARQLENYFHGQSSGVDIAGSMHDHGVVFTLPAQIAPLTLTWRPQLYLSHSNHVSITTKCVQQVRELHEINPIAAKKIDEKMATSVQLAQQALQNSHAQSLSLLTEALVMGQQCFQEWGLINLPLQQHIQQLMQAGALAAKPTGAGDGGYVLSLWNKLPDVACEMIAVF